MEELELTYLPTELPEGYRDSPSKEILDIYLPGTSEHPTLRIRKAGEKREMTKKEPIKGQDSSHQLETTIPLTADEYSDLSKLPGKRVRKTRYYYRENGVDYEIGVFEDELKGLVMVDVEFDSIEKKEAFVPPAWFLTEVTQEKFAAGGMLCGKKYSDIEMELNRFGYRKMPLK